MTDLDLSAIRCEWCQSRDASTAEFGNIIIIYCHTCGSVIDVTHATREDGG